MPSMMQKPLSIASLADHVARYHGDTEIISVSTDGSKERTTWGEVIVNARRLAASLEALGLKQGDRCGTIAWNNRRHLEIYFGVAAGGYVCHTINPRLSAEQLAYIINDADDRVLFVDATFLPLVNAIRDKIPSVTKVFLLGPGQPAEDTGIDGLTGYDTLLETASVANPWPEIDENSPSSLCYTSGTTGRPKGVLYTHRSTLLHTLSANNPDGLAISASDCVLPVVPMFHVNAWGTPYIAAAMGAKLVLPGPALDGESLARLIESESVTLALGVPTIWMGLLKGLETTGCDVKTLRRSIVGGSALPPAMTAAFRDLHGVTLIHAWGMTETSPLGTINYPLEKHKMLPVEERDAIASGQGRPPYGVELRLVDDGGEVIDSDGTTQGELQIRGHWIVDTYFGGSESVLNDDGWFDTGDIATIDADGYMNIRDRSKDIIKSGGEWISTVELENHVIAHPAVTNAAAIAARHEKWDERPVLIVQLQDGATVTEDELLAFYDGKVPSWQVPDRVVFVDTLPLGATGKVLKAELRETYGDILLS